MEKTGKDFQIVDKTTTKYKPRNKQVGTSYVHSGINKPVKTKMKIEINRIVHQILATPEVNARLERLSIPDIRARETKHLNHYGEMSNDKIEYQTHTFNSYLSANQFLNFVVARIQKAPIEMEHKSYHLARQFNQIYNNWDETVKNQQSYQGKTDAYKLDKFGMDEKPENTRNNIIKYEYIITEIINKKDLYIICSKSSDFETHPTNIPLNIYEIDYNSVDVSSDTFKYTMPDMYFNKTKDLDLYLDNLIKFKDYIVYNDAELALSILIAFKQLMPK
jgi:hypothetical protein